MDNVISSSLVTATSSAGHASGIYAGYSEVVVIYRETFACRRLGTGFMAWQSHFMERGIVDIVLATD
jgi:hypothetical protein